MSTKVICQVCRCAYVSNRGRATTCDDLCQRALAAGLSRTAQMNDETKIASRIPKPGEEPKEEEQ